MEVHVAPVVIEFFRTATKHLLGKGASEWMRRGQIDRLNSFAVIPEIPLALENQCQLLVRQEGNRRTLGHDDGNAPSWRSLRQNSLLQDEHAQ